MGHASRSFFPEQMLPCLPGAAESGNDRNVG